MGQDKYVAYVSTYTIGDQREHGITVFDVDMEDFTKRKRLKLRILLM